MVKTILIQFKLIIYTIINHLGCDIRNRRLLKPIRNKNYPQRLCFSGIKTNEEFIGPFSEEMIKISNANTNDKVTTDAI